MRQISKILDIPFDRVTQSRALEIMLGAVSSDHKPVPFFAATPNPEILLKTLHQPQYREILKGTDMNLADGIGILWAATYLASIKPCFSRLHKGWIALKYLAFILLSPCKIRQILPERVSGSDIMEKLCSMINKNCAVFLLGAEEGIAKSAGEILKKKYSITVSGTYSGSPAEEQDSIIRKLVDDSGAQVLFVAFGAPKQEIWLERNLPHLKSVRLAMGVGGTFDFIAGKLKRAPKVFRYLGLEWLFRLFQQPSRVKRIYNATVKFPLTVYKNSL